MSQGYRPSRSRRNLYRDWASRRSLSRGRRRGFALRLLLGEVADVVTTGQRVLPRKADLLAYPFRFPDIDGALTEVLAATAQPPSGTRERRQVRNEVRQGPQS